MCIESYAKELFMTKTRHLLRWQRQVDLLSSRSVWATYQDQGQPWLPSEILFQKRKIQKQQQQQWIIHQQQQWIIRIFIIHFYHKMLMSQEGMSIL